MTSTHFDVDDARSDRAAELREQRARARAERNGQEPEPEQPKSVKPESNDPTPGYLVDRTRPEPVDAAPARPLFTPVDELPGAQAPRRGTVPEARQALIEYCRKWPGQWVRYEAIPDRDHTKPHALAAMARKAQGGFTRGFECKVRAKVPYVRFNGEES